MAIVAISVNTNTREAMLTVDGEMVPATSCHLEKFIDTDGRPRIELAFTVEQSTDNGLVERRLFFMPREEDEIDASVVSKDGLASRVVKDDEEVARDIAKYLIKT